MSHVHAQGHRAVTYKAGGTTHVARTSTMRRSARPSTYRYHSTANRAPRHESVHALEGSAHTGRHTRNRARHHSKRYDPPRTTTHAAPGDHLAQD
eukprot:137100-Alexandrium_andersonii.AAC.1